MTLVALKSTEKESQNWVDSQHSRRRCTLLLARFSILVYRESQPDLYTAYYQLYSARCYLRAGTGWSYSHLVRRVATGQLYVTIGTRR